MERPELDNFDRTMIAIISIAIVLLSIYLFVSSFYEDYIENHYILFNESEIEETVHKWEHDAKNGDVLMVLVYDASKKRNKEITITNYLKRKYLGTEDFYIATVNQSKKSNEEQLYHLGLISDKLPMLYTLSKTDGTINIQSSQLKVKESRRTLLKQLKSIDKKASH
ncbi:hypothetical protein ACR56S_04015 [Staphylococcus hominis]|uniref:hypothetical protein n=1 Tax=Staphylococcus hominis TaxID=1290 RepID=UPI003DA045D1